MKKMYQEPRVRVALVGMESMVAYTRMKTDGLGDEMGQGKDDNGEGEDPIFGDVKEGRIWSEEW